MSLSLQTFDYLPPGFLESKAKNLHQLFSEPCLIHLKGKKENPLFISIIQHGNETVGLYAVQQLLKAYSQTQLPRSLSIFVANIDAAREGVRRLDTQPDYNRMWIAENQPIEYAEARVMQQVIFEMKKRKPFASIDIHSNTGLNPHYACINKQDNQFYHLATLFSKTVVYFIRPLGVQSTAFSQFCPSVTLECGSLEDKSGIEHAFEYLDACIQLNTIPDSNLQLDEMDLFHTVATVKVPREFSFSFVDSTEDLYFSQELEKYNFIEVQDGALFALTHSDKEVVLNVINESGENQFEKYFTRVNNEIRLKKNMMPSMLTLNEKVIRQDCLCYLMERIPF